MSLKRSKRPNYPTRRQLRAAESPVVRKKRLAKLRREMEVIGLFSLNDPLESTQILTGFRSDAYLDSEIKPSSINKVNWKKEGF